MNNRKLLSLALAGTIALQTGSALAGWHLFETNNENDTSFLPNCLNPKVIKEKAISIYKNNPKTVIAGASTVALATITGIAYKISKMFKKAPKVIKKSFLSRNKGSFLLGGGLLAAAGIASLLWKFKNPEDRAQLYKNIIDKCENTKDTCSNIWKSGKDKFSRAWNSTRTTASKLFSKKPKFYGPQEHENAAILVRLEKKAKRAKKIEKEKLAAISRKIKFRKKIKKLKNKFKNPGQTISNAYEYTKDGLLGGCKSVKDKVSNFFNPAKATKKRIFKNIKLPKKHSELMAEIKNFNKKKLKPKVPKRRYPKVKTKEIEEEFEKFC